MVPVRGPIIDYENPFYCADPLQFCPFGVVFDTASDVVLHRSHHSVQPATLAYNPERTKKNRHFDVETSSPSIYAFVHDRNCLADAPKRLVPGYDSSPCARIPSCLDRRIRNTKRSRYTSPRKKLASLAIPGGQRKEPCRIKQEYSSPVLLVSPDRDKPIHPLVAEEYEEKPEIAPERSTEGIVTTQTLLLRLEEIFPRIGFKEAADSIQDIWQESNIEYRSERHQALVDLLGKRGALNEYILAALRDAEFRYLDLGPTMGGVNKLDLPLGDVMHAFSQPGWFKNLKMVSFAGGRFRADIDLAHIRSLCRIEALVLTNTGIGNEGVFHIVALKCKLLHLDLSENPSINDDSIPALILLENLHYLSLVGTGISMPGVRKLAVAVKESERVADIKVPSMCKDYIADMHTQYLLYPASPLISDPGVASLLSESALSRNLEAHAAVNSSIVYTGPRNEMEERLRRILEVRALDLVVREMLAGQDEAR